MKLYGKRTLAMLLIIAIAMSLCSMTAFATSTTATGRDDLEYSMKYTGDSNKDKIELDLLISELLEEEYKYDRIVIDPDHVELDKDYVDFKYGTIRNCTYRISSEDVEAALKKSNSLDEAPIYYTAYDEDKVEYYGRLYITINGNVEDFEYDLDGDNDFAFGEWIADQLSKVMSEDLNYVEFDLDRDNDCGTLYMDSDLTKFDEKETYYYKSNDRRDLDVEDLYFVPNGKKGEFVIYYYAEGMDREELEGIITIVCSEYLSLKVSINSDETYTFDTDDFQDAVDEWSSDYTLVYLDNVKITTTNGGTLYYDYDEESRRNTPISSTEEYYADKDEDDLIDYITYVPGEKTEGTVTISFDAYVQKSRGRSETLAGILEITLTEKADITIEANREELVEIDPDLFQDYLEDDIDSTRYKVAYVEINDAPRTSSTGYLVADKEDLTKRGTKTFYMDPDKNEYDLEDLYYMGGTTSGTYKATFTVFYYKNNSSRASATNEGTIEFVVGSNSSSSTNDTLSGSVKGSQVMNFSDYTTLASFKKLGNNDNTYVIFTNLPTGGKLVYNWGTSSQEDVKIDTAYYINYAYNAKQVSNVTFVPNYSSNKRDTIINIPVKAYNAKGKSVTGTILISVDYLTASEYFTDVQSITVGGTYADSVDFLYNQGITNGITATTFGPNSNVTRAQFVTFLYRAAGQPAVTGVTNQFTDVKPTGTYGYAYNAILWAVQNNITTGRSATTFDPAANVTHQELLTFLYRYDVNYLGHPGTQGSLTGFSDASSLQSYAVAPAKWAAYKGIVSGYTLQPAVAGTRATVALWLHRMLTL